MQFKRSNDYRNSAEENEYEDCEVKMKISGAKKKPGYEESEVFYVIRRTAEERN